MTARTLLAELEAAGVRLSREGDELRYQTRPEVRIEPYRALIAANKPALLVELIRAEILAAVHGEPEHFDRERYEAL